MNIYLEHSGFKMSIIYSDSGILEYVINSVTKEYMMIESKFSGAGYEIKNEPFMLNINTCDARYSRVVDADLYIPRRIFIKPPIN